ncbi:hypothetical protein ACIQNU_09415 [Streptomyces sp. NPDC091292]|uniref:hypothetical protein n=1 Tax=Streptomyces sp. NPDC091292 TaxID=3365991 RepID=UPI00382652C4
MQRIEFLNYAVSDHLSYRLWGFRVDGTDLRVRVADATRELWRQEQEEKSPDERERFLRAQHAGLPLQDIDDPGRHFLGDPAPEFAAPSPGATPVLGCACGVWECWPLLTVITSTPETVTWSSFRQPFRPEWGELSLGPYVFERSAYEAALAKPVHLTKDPWAVDDEATP